MNQVQVDDLKQFIETTIVTQLDIKLEEKLDKKLDEKLSIHEARLISYIDNRFDEALAAIGDIMSTTNYDTDRRFGNHERRIKRLEQRASGL